MSTNAGLVYNGQSGQPFSYVYFGDINGESVGMSPEPQFQAFQQYEQSTDYCMFKQHNKT